MGRPHGRSGTGERGLFERGNLNLTTYGVPTGPGEVGWPRSRASTSACPKAASSVSSARTGPGRPRRSGRRSACCAAPRGGSACWAPTCRDTCRRPWTASARWSSSRRSSRTSPAGGTSELLGRHASDPGATVDATLGRVGLGARADSPFATYSLGMKQRLGIAAALMKEPDLLILDEPAERAPTRTGILGVRMLMRDVAKAARSSSRVTSSPRSSTRATGSRSSPTASASRAVASTIWLPPRDGRYSRARVPTICDAATC